MDDTFLFIFGTLFLLIFKNLIDLKNKEILLYILIFFILSPVVYLAVSLIDKTKRTDYPEKK